MKRIVSILLILMMASFLSVTVAAECCEDGTCEECTGQPVRRPCCDDATCSDCVSVFVCTCGESSCAECFPPTATTADSSSTGEPLTTGEIPGYTEPPPSTGDEYTEAPPEEETTTARPRTPNPYATYEPGRDPNATPPGGHGESSYTIEPPPFGNDNQGGNDSATGGILERNGGVPIILFIVAGALLGGIAIATPLIARSMRIERIYRY
jgi:hypothetical protein